MPPKDDITQTGLLNYRDLQDINREQLLNSAYRSLEYNNIPGQRIRNVQNTYIPQTISLDEYTKDNDYLEKRHDVSYIRPEDFNSEYVNETRALNQSGAEQLVNGILKGAFTAGTTFVNTMAGIPTGVMTSVAEGRISGLWDNAVTNALNKADEWIEQVLPNYYSREELESPWYQNIFTANFLGDKIIKNFGFTVGAAGAAKVISRLPKMLPKLARNAALASGNSVQDALATARAVNSFEGAFLGAVGEGSIEALNGTKEWAREMTSRVEQDKQNKINAIYNEYSGYMNEIQDQYGNTEVGRQLLISANSEMQQKINDIEADYNQKLGYIADQRARQGNLILAANIPVLTATNLFTLGKVFAKGYSAEAASMGRYVASDMTNLAKAGQTVKETKKILTLKGIKEKEKDVIKHVYSNKYTNGRIAAKAFVDALSEGNEEMMQATITRFSKNLANDYYALSVDPDATDVTANTWKSLGDAFVDTYGNVDSWEEFAIGMLSGGVSNIVMGSVGVNREQKKAVQTLVDRANAAVENKMSQSVFRGMNRHQVTEDQMTNAAIRGDKKEFKDAEFNQLASDVMTFGEIGKLDDLKALVDYNLDNLTDDEIEQIAESLRQEDPSGAEHNEFVNMSNEQRREYLKNQHKRYHDMIDAFEKERDEINGLVGNSLSIDQKSEAIFNRLKLKDATFRYNDILKDVKESITKQSDIYAHFDTDIAEMFGVDIAKEGIDNLNQLKTYIADNVDNIVKMTARDLYSGNREANVKQLIGLQIAAMSMMDSLSATDVNQKIRDLVKLSADMLYYDERMNDMLTHPEHTEERKNKINSTVQDKVNSIKARRIAKNIKNPNSFRDIRDAISGVSPEIRKKVLKELEENGSTEASNFNDKETLYRHVNTFIGESNYDPIVKQRVADLFNNALEVMTLDALKNADDGIYSRESNADLTDEQYEDLQSLIHEALNYAKDEQDNAPELHEEESTTQEATKEGSEEQPRSKNYASIIEELQDSTDQQELSPEEAPKETIKEQPKQKEEQNTEVKEEIPDYNKDQSPEIDETKTILEGPVDQPFNGIAVGQTRLDRRTGKPYVDKDGNILPLREALEELHAFDNQEKGLVKPNIRIKFGIYPKLDKTIKERSNYDTVTILLFVEENGENKCVGNLNSKKENDPEYNAFLRDIRNKLLAEFKGKTNTDKVLVSDKYSTKCVDLITGNIMYDESKTYRPITQQDMDNASKGLINQDTPILAVYDGNGSFDTNKTAGIKLMSGIQVKDVFTKYIYPGTVCMMVPTAGFDSTKPNNIDQVKAYIPVGLKRTKLSKMDKSTRTIRTLENTIRGLFNSKFIDARKAVSEIEKLITYKYNTQERPNQKVFIDFGAYLESEFKEFEPSNSDLNNYYPAVVRITVVDDNNKKETIERQTRAEGGTYYNPVYVSEEYINESVNKIMDFFENQCDAFMNVNKNKLDESDYVKQVINDNLVTTNAIDFTVVGDSFTIEPKIYEGTENIQPKQEEKQIPDNPLDELTGFKSKDSTNDEYLMGDLENSNGVFDEEEPEELARVESIRSTDKLIDIDNEINDIMKMFPQLNKDEAFDIVDGFIKVKSIGQYAMGMFRRGVITLSKLAEVGTGYHEAFHLAYHMLLNNDEIKELHDQYSKMHKHIKNRVALEELMAEDFMEYCMFNNDKSLVDIVKRFFRKLRNIVLGYKNNQTAVEKIFSDIYNGKLADREIKKTNKTRFAKEDYTDEMQKIKDQAIADDTFMKAPNGNPTNLNERQWLQVRTKAFKDWFGDWENDSANASKVVDENGEPLVVYHGSKSKFNIFDTKYNKQGYWEFSNGDKIPMDTNTTFFFTDNKASAKVYTLKGWTGSEISNLNLDSINKMLSAKKAINKLDKSLIIDKKYSNIISEVLNSGIFFLYFKKLNLNTSFYDKIKELSIKNNTDYSFTIHQNKLSLRYRDRVGYDDYETKYIDLPLEYLDDAKYVLNSVIDIKLDRYQRNNESSKINLDENVYSTFLNIKKPFIFDYEGKSIQGKYKDKYPIQYINARQVKKAIEEGYDGVIYKNISDPYNMTSYGVFNPNQIKSATDNIGTFSRENNDIRFRLIGKTREEIMRNAYEQINEAFSHFAKKIGDDHVYNIGEFTAIDNQGKEKKVPVKIKKYLMVFRNGKYSLNKGKAYDRFNNEASVRLKRSEVIYKNPRDLYNEVIEYLKRERPYGDWRAVKIDEYGNFYLDVVEIDNEFLTLEERKQNMSIDELIQYYQEVRKDPKYIEYEEIAYKKEYGDDITEEEQYIYDNFFDKFETARICYI